jgi:hypothetical protein
MADMVQLSVVITDQNCSWNFNPVTAITSRKAILS